MPNYYSGDNPFTSAGAAAMAGFELFQRMKERRSAEEQRKLDNDRTARLDKEAADQRALENARAGEQLEMQRTRFALEQGEYSRSAEERVENEAAARAGDLAKLYGNTPEARAAWRGDARRASRFAGASDAEIDAAFESYAMRGSDYLEEEAVGERNRTRARDIALRGMERFAASPSQPPDYSVGYAPRTRGGGPPPRTVSHIQLNGQENSELLAAAGGNPDKERFLRTVLAVENRGSAEFMRSGAVSPAGAAGPFQFTAETAQAFGLDPSQRGDFRLSVHAAGRYYDELAQRYGGNFDAMLADYNGGPAQASAVMQGQLPAAAETQEYLQLARGLGPIGSAPTAASQGGGSGTAQVPAASAPAPAAPPERKSLLGVAAPTTSIMDRSVRGGRVAPGNPAITSAVAGALVRPEYLAALDPADPRGNAFRANPVAKYSDYVDGGRKYLSFTDRMRTDTLMFDGLTAQIKAARANGDAARVESLSAKVAELNSIRAKDTIAQAVPNGKTPPSGAAAAAVRTAAEQRQSGPVEATPEKIRGIQTRGQRLAANPPRRLSRADMELLADGVAHGLWSMDAAMTAAQYGTFHPPKPSEVKTHVIQGGLAVVSDAGIQFVESPFAVKGEKALAGSEMRLRSEPRLKEASSLLSSALDSGDIDPWGTNPSPARVYADYVQTFTRNAPELERALGMRLSEPGTDAVTWGHLDPGQVAISVNAFTKFASNELYAISPAGRSFVDYMRDEVGAPSQSARGFVAGQIYETADGKRFRYTGGDDTDPQNFQPVTGD